MVFSPLVLIRYGANSTAAVHGALLIRLSLTKLFAFDQAHTFFLFHAGVDGSGHHFTKRTVIFLN
jgi:hypothetical protein